jgi:arginine/lysine/ornithine decarboxylase
MTDVAPVLNAIAEFQARGDIVYGPPGHKHGRGVDPDVLELLGRGMFAADVLSLNGFDDRTESRKVLKAAEKLMAEAVHADEAFFATCGSSMSVKTAMICVAGPGEKLLLARNAHKSVVTGLVISGIDPVWIPARFDDEWQLTHPPGPAELAPLLDAHPDAKGALLITPTDWGSCADLRGAAEVCHDHDVPLIVDEAWGAHLPFHDELPTWGMDAGADVVVTSVHKMGCAIEQSSVYHLQGDRVPAELLSHRAEIFGTTSSSPLVYATLDGWRRQMVRDGKRLWGEALVRAERIRNAIRAIGGLDLMDRQVLGPRGAFELDPMRITVDVRPLNISGYQAADWLREHHRVDVGAADSAHLGMQITIGDDDETEARLLDALRALADAASGFPPPRPVPVAGPELFEAERAMLPRDAFFAPAEHIPVERAAGRIAAEMLSPYPPGVPIVIPGEVLTQAALDHLVAGAAAGMHIPDAADTTMATVRVVAE